MEKPFKKPFAGIIDPAQIRAKQIAEEEQKRFEKIADQIIEILKKENVIIEEMPRIYQTINAKLNKKMDKAEIEKILKL